MSALNITIDPFVSPDLENWAVKQFLRLLFELNTILVPVGGLAKVVFTQVPVSGDVPNEDAHEFQVYTADARNWIDLLELVRPDKIAPRLTRTSNGSEFSYPEWEAIVALREAILQAHNALSEPGLMQFVFSSGALATVLYVNPTTAVHSQGQITINWHAPTAGHLDWIGLFLHTSPNTGPYVSFQVVPDGQVDGTFNFNTPAVAGAYEFRYLPANGYVSTALSVPLTVT